MAREMLMAKTVAVLKDLHNTRYFQKRLAIWLKLQSLRKSPQHSKLCKLSHTIPKTNPNPNPNPNPIQTRKYKVWTSTRIAFCENQRAVLPLKAALINNQRCHLSQLAIGIQAKFRQQYGKNPTLNDGYHSVDEEKDEED